LLLVTIAFWSALSFASEVDASLFLVSADERRPLKVQLTLSPSTPRRGGTMVIVVRVEDETGAASGAAVKVLLSFNDGRQRSISGLSGADGMLKITVRINPLTSPGIGKVDVIVRLGMYVAIESSTFTVK